MYIAIIDHVIPFYFFHYLFLGTHKHMHTDLPIDTDKEIHTDGDV